MQYAIMNKRFAMTNNNKLTKNNDKRQICNKQSKKWLINEKTDNW